MTEEVKVCSKCEIAKSVSEFGPVKASKDGLNRRCRHCVLAGRDKENLKLWRENNKARIRELGRLSEKRQLSDPNSPRSLRNKSQEAKDYHAAWYLLNREKVLASCKERQASRKPEIQEYNRLHYIRNKARKALTSRLWQQSNKDRVNALVSKYRAKKKLATPAWTDFEKVVSFYTSSHALGMLTGEWYHVDHIVPIQSEFVCGLHCEQNLRVITGKDNVTKGNRWWPDMWEKENSNDNV
jgi:hypothetical protein